MSQLQRQNVTNNFQTVAMRTPQPVPLTATVNAEPVPPSLAVEYFRMMVRRRKWVIATAICGAVIGLVSTLAMEPVYQARTSLEVQGVNENFMDMRTLNPNAAPGADTAESFIQTQIKLIQSESIIARAARKLASDAPAVPAQKTDYLSRLKTMAGWGSGQTRSVEQQINEIAHSVKVKPMGMTRLVQITCAGTTASLAASFCNTLASEYIKHDLELRSDTAQKTGEYLTQQLQDVRKNLENNERLLENYAQQTTLLSSGEKEGVAQEKLRHLQTELSQAQADRIVKQSQYELISSASAESLPPVLDNGPLREYQTKLSDLKQQYADLSSSFTNDYPKVQRLQAQIRELESTLTKERANVISRIKNEFEASKHRESLLSASYNAQAQTVSALAPKQTQYNMLMHEVESGRQLYATLMQRVKEAGLISAMHASPVRVVDAAKTSSTAVSPRPLLSGAGGLLLGCLGGVFLAFFHDRSDRRLQKPGEATLQLRVRELGVIPAANVDKLPITARAGNGAKLSVLPGGMKLLGPASGESTRGLETITWSNKGSLMAESYRGVMSSLLFSGMGSADGKIRLVISSPSVSEGKTTLVSNLGIAFAQTKRSVVLVDGDMRRPRLHKIFNLDNSVGLSNVLMGEIDPITCPLDKIVRATTVPGLYVIPGGSPVDDAASTLFSPHLGPLLERLNREFSAMLIDSPPMLHLSDARVLARHADGVVLVVRAGATTREDATTAQQIFESDATEIFGIVLNDFDPSHELNMNYYKSYHEYQRQSA